MTALDIIQRNYLIFFVHLFFWFTALAQINTRISFSQYSTLYLHRQHQLLLGIYLMRQLLRLLLVQRLLLEVLGVEQVLLYLLLQSTRRFS